MESDVRGIRITRRSQLVKGDKYDLYIRTGSGIPRPGGPYTYEGFQDVNNNLAENDPERQSTYMFKMTTAASGLPVGTKYTPSFHMVEGQHLPDGTLRTDELSGTDVVFNNTNDVLVAIYKHGTGQCAGGGCSIMGGRRKYKRKTNKRKTNKRKMKKRKTKMRY
jgi:hypothetical protein